MYYYKYSYNNNIWIVSKLPKKYLKDETIFKDNNGFKLIMIIIYFEY